MEPQTESAWVDYIGLFINCGLPIILLALGFAVGGITDRRHRARLTEREATHAGMLLTNLRAPPGVGPEGEGGVIVNAEVVIAADYFKSFIAKLVKIIGGEMKTYRSLMERARREAIVRLVEQAREQGYQGLCNIRMETADIGGGATSKKNSPAAMVAVLAWGTAYTLPADAHRPNAESPDPGSSAHR